MHERLKNGYLSEQRFIVEAMENDVLVSKPITNTEIYDFVVDVNKSLYRVQVKKSWKDKKDRNIVTLRSCYPRSDIRRSLTEYEEVDFLAIDCKDEGNWYIIPLDVIRDVKSAIAVRNTGKYAKYINNWGFHKDDNHLFMEKPQIETTL